MPEPETIEVQLGLKYLFHPQHRNNTPEKSQWSIGKPEEKFCFIKAHKMNWLSDDTGWGLHFVQDEIEYLGNSHDRKRQLFIAKFLASPDHILWHGFPADCQANLYDIPTEEIQANWLKTGILSAAKIKKIAGGRLCRL